MGSSRNKSDLKEKVTSVRMSEEQHRKIQEKAAKKGLKSSTYMLLSALNDDNSNSSQQLVHMQQIVNIAAENVGEFAPEVISYLQEEADRLWQE